MLAECATAETLSDQGVDGLVVPRPAMESDCDNGSKGSSARHTNRPDGWEQRWRSGETARWKRRDQKCNTATAPVGRGLWKPVHGAAVVLERLREEALTAVESWYGSDLRAMGKPPETRATMVLEPLRKEALTDGDADRRDKPLNSYDDSETNTDAQPETMDPVLPTVGGTTAERPYGQCHVIGTWDNFRDLHEMTWEGGAYRYCVMLGVSAEESFQIAVDGLRTRQIYQSIEEASPHVDHSLRGPDNGGSGVFRTVATSWMPRSVTLHVTS